jgi:hypothetical protein
MNFKTFEPRLRRSQSTDNPRLSVYLGNNQIRFNKHALEYLKINDESRVKFHYDIDRKTWLIEICKDGYHLRSRNANAPVITAKQVVAELVKMYKPKERSMFFDVEAPHMTTDKGTFYKLKLIS